VKRRGEQMKGKRKEKWGNITPSFEGFMFSIF
jgi:uncharacterized protein YjbJ (UPF0337 family)